jgi:hypothetical protein
VAGGLPVNRCRPMPADVNPTEFSVTLAVFAASLTLVAVMAWLERRPRRGLDPPLVPTTPFLFIGAMVGLLAFVHLLNLLGFHTGRN